MSESERTEGGLVASALAPDVGTAILPAAPQAPAVDLTADFGLPVSAQRKRWSLSLLAALTVHAIVLAALIPRASDLAEGSGVELDGIDVDVVSAATLERPPSADHRSGTGADVAAAGVIGAGSTALVAAAIPEEADQKRVQERQDTPHQEPPLMLKEEPSPEPRPDDLPVASKNEPDKPKEEPEPVEAKPDPAQAPSAAAEATPPQDAGGAAAPGAATKAQVAMAASGGASPAAVARYKRSVVESLAAHKPKGKPGIRGTVRVAFKISRVGEIDSARVVNSSGRKELDEAALSAVQATRFQPPPPGLTTDDLHYEIPYYFR